MRQSPILTGASILIVEDDVIQALDLTASLEEAGAEVCGPFFNLERAANALKTEAFSAAIIDFRLASQDTALLAYEFYRQEIPFIVYTGCNETQSLPSHWPGCRIVAKPAYLPKLMWQLAGLIHWKQHSHERNEYSPHEIAV